MRYRILAALAAAVGSAVLVWVALIQMKLWLLRQSLLGGAIETGGYLLPAAQAMLFALSCLASVVAIRRARNGSGGNNDDGAVASRSPDRRGAATGR